MRVKKADFRLAPLQVAVNVPQTVDKVQTVPSKFFPNQLYPSRFPGSLSDREQPYSSLLDLMGLLLVFYMFSKASAALMLIRAPRISRAVTRERVGLDFWLLSCAIQASLHAQIT